MGHSQLLTHGDFLSGKSASFKKLIIKSNDTLAPYNGSMHEKFLKKKKKETHTQRHIGKFK